MLLAHPTSIVLKGVPLTPSQSTRADPWHRPSPATPDSGKQLSTGPIGALQLESGVKSWGTAAVSRGLNLGLAFRAEVVASQAASNLGIRSEMPRQPQSGGWLVLKRVSEPDHTAGNITQAFRPRIHAFSVLENSEYLGCFSPEFAAFSG